MVDVGIQTDVAQESRPYVSNDDVDQLKKELEECRERLSATQSELARISSDKFGIDKFKNSDEALCFYTGFPDYDRFKVCFDFCTSSHFPSSWKLTPLNQFFMVMCRLRLGLLEIGPC